MRNYMGDNNIPGILLQVYLVQGIDQKQPNYSVPVFHIASLFAKFVNYLHNPFLYTRYQYTLHRLYIISRSTLYVQSI